MIDRRTLAVTIAALLVVLFAVESFFPLRRRRRSVLSRLLVNGGVSALTFATALFVVRPAMLEALQWSSHTQFGLAHAISMPWTVQFVLSCLALDLTFYWWHLANHKVPF